jgi:glycine/D-amino acid oxidase-like deaminating enzyme
VKDYARYSFWLETAGEPLTPRVPLDRSIEADVAIMGAGFSGLWTAYYLLRQDPKLRVVIIEQEIAGFGASGRNGGWCSNGFAVSPAQLTARYGSETARQIGRLMNDAVDEVGRIAAEEGIDAEYLKGGDLLVARGPHHLSALEHELHTLEELGLADGLQMLDAAGTAARVRITGAIASLYNPHCAVVHPGRLVRGLARAVERRGGTIYEQTAVTDYAGGEHPFMQATGGTVHSRTIVLAGEAYLTRLPGLHRHLLPVYSLIVLTEPLGQAQWEQIGWRAHECIASPRYTVDYLSRTADGRLLFGGRGAPYHYGSRIDDAFDRHRPTHNMLRGQVLRWFPMLRGVRFTHAWGGPLGIPRDWLPTMSFDRASGIALVGGYTGQGVATSNLSGRVLADLIRGVQSPLTALPMSSHRIRPWEPEPLRWLGVRLTQEGLRRVDDRAARTGQPPTGTTLAERLGKH